MDGTFLVNHEEVNKTVKSLTAYIETDILAEAEAGYGQINELLQKVDGATNEQLIKAMEYNLEKIRAASGMLSRLLIYIENASRELESEDAKMAKEIGAVEGSVQ